MLQSCVLSEAKKKHRKPKTIKNVVVEACIMNPKTNICEPIKKDPKK